MINGKPADGRFFDLNKDLRYVLEFSDLISAYGEEMAGRIVWAIYLIYHPDSEFYDMSPDDKVRKVEEKFLEDKFVQWGLLVPSIDVFPKVAMTRETRMYYDAVNLYEESVADARLMTPKDKQIFLKGMEATAAVLERFKEKYLAEKTSGSQIRSAGELQSGFLSRKRGNNQ